MKHLLPFKNFIINESNSQKTLDKKDVQDKLLDMMTRRGIKINIIDDSIDISSSKIKIKADYLNQETLDTINNFMDSNGWFPANIKLPGEPKLRYSQGIKNSLNKMEVEIGYEEKLGGEFDINKNKTKAYHVTPDILVDKIKEQGLTPKSESKLSDHPDRVYLFLNPEETFNQMVRQLWNSLSIEKKKTIKNYYVLEIDLTKIPGHRFYLDPQSSLTYMSIFTTQPIPSLAIKVIDKIPTKDIKPLIVLTPEEIKREEEETRRREMEWEEMKKEKEKDDYRYNQFMRKMDQIGDDKLNISLDDLLKYQK